MATPIVVPGLGESVTEATVAKWMKKVGDPVKADEALAELETDKVTQELYAPTAGTLGEITAPEGSVVAIGAVIGQITRWRRCRGRAGQARARRRAAARCAGPSRSARRAAPPKSPAAETLSPAVRKMVAENNVDPAAVAGTGKDGRLTKGDVTAHLAKPAAPQISPAPQHRAGGASRAAARSAACAARPRPPARSGCR